MAKPAQFCTWNFIFAGFIGLEPTGNFSTGDHVLFETKIGHKEAVNNILRGQDDPDRFTGWHADIVIDLLVIRCVELSIRTGIENLPVELLASNLDDGICLGGDKFDLLP